MTDRKRSWGYWTRAKLRVLADYLDAFTTAAKSQKERIYLDAFAGEGSGVDRLTGEEFTASARIALEVQDPSFTKFRFFELPAKARALEKQLNSEYPGRDIRVYPGDSNATIPTALADLKRLRWAPTFAFLDPDGMQLSWNTLESLAGHKHGYRRPGAAKPEYKIEMWMLFPTQGLIRTLTLKKPPAEADARRASRLFGSDAWRAIYESRLRNELTGEQAALEYLNLMRYRLERDLGYRWTHPLAIKNLKGRLIYHMIFATDNAAGTKIITDLYQRAARDIPQMREEILRELKQPGQLQLDLGQTAEQALAAPYGYEKPWEPPSAGGV